MISKIKAIIFDFDGVILDSVNIKTLAFEEMYSHYGEEIKKKVREYHLLNGGISRVEKIKYYHKNFLNIKISETKLKNLTNVFSDLVFEKVCDSDFIDGAFDFLNYVNDRYLTFICTGTPENEINKILDIRNLSNYFNEVHGSPNSKTIIIKDILEKYNLDNNEVLFIGDAMTDYNASKENRLNFIGVENSETNFPKGTIVVKNLMEIINLTDQKIN